MKTTFIYSLSDPMSGKIRYIGKSDDPYSRWVRHCFCDRSRNHKSNWIRGLKAVGLLPILEILEEVPYVQWEEIEQEYIRVFRLIGIPLTNTCEGGQGATGPKTEQHRKNISAAQAGKKQSEATIEKRRSKLIGKHRTLEAIEKYRKSKLGDKNPQFGKSGAQSPQFGKIRSKKTRLLQRLAKLGKPWTEAQRLSRQK